MRRLLLALFIVPSAGAQSAPQARPDSGALALRNRVMAAEIRFFHAWDTLWMRSERARHSFVVIGDLMDDASPRRQAYHCHPEYEVGARSVTTSRLIRNATGHFSVCPSFDLGDVETPGDERTRLDDALIDSLIPVARQLRAALIATLDSAADVLPTDDVIVGQRVRFLLDQWEHEKATAVARDCRGTAWWCSALAGLVLSMRVQPIAAESAFDAAYAAMPKRERCQWNDLRYIIDFEARLKYARSNCEERDALNERIWWLADPFFTERGNERKVEQYVRMVLIRLRTALARDERYTWLRNQDDDAHQVMLVRYGWPAFAFWGGPFEDRSHTSYLAQHGTPANPPYTTYEYTGPRVHSLPAWDAIEKPYESIPSDWTLVAPDRREPPIPRSLTRPTPDTPPRRTGVWWPVEHFAPRLNLVQLYGGQQAVLRRNSGTLVAVATYLDPDRLQRRRTDTIPSISLVTSQGPERVQRVANKRGPMETTFEIHGVIGPGAALAGLEYPAGRGGPGGRLRFGVAALEPLSSVTGQFAISAPIILLPPAGVEETPNEIEAALRLMAPSHVVSDAKKIGVYWETYGFEPADSVELAVWIERYTPQGIGRRFGIAFGISTDLNTPIAITWKEPQPGYRSHVFREGRVSVIGRSLTIDVAALPAGDYRLQVAIRKGAGEPVRGQSAFIVR
jgi:hypothetical protein